MRCFISARDLLIISAKMTSCSGLTRITCNLCSYSSTSSTCTYVGTATRGLTGSPCGCSWLEGFNGIDIEGELVG